MEDPEITTEEPSQTAEPAVDESTDSSPPWGEDFDAQRAWNTLQNLRSEEKELKQKVRELETPWTDEEVFQQIARERYGYEFEDDDDEYEEDEQQEPYLTREEFAQWQAQQEVVGAEQAFNADLSELVAESDIELRPGDYHELYAACMQGGADYEALKTAVTEFAKERKDYDQQVLKRYRDSKSGSFVSPVGSEATEKPDLDDDTTRQKWMAERWAQAQQ